MRRGKEAADGGDVDYYDLSPFSGCYVGDCTDESTVFIQPKGLDICVL